MCKGVCVCACVCVCMYVCMYVCCHCSKSLDGRYPLDLWVLYQAVDNLRLRWDPQQCGGLGTTHSVVMAGDTSRRHDN